MLGFVMPKGNVTLGVGFCDTWKMWVCLWEPLSYPERCWASFTWTKSCDLRWACSSVPRLCISRKISWFASCGRCRACSAGPGLLSPGEIPEVTASRLSAWSSRNLIHRNQVQLWLKAAEFSCGFPLGLSENFIKREVSGVLRNGQHCKRCPVMLSELWGTAFAFPSTFNPRGCLWKGCA